MKVFVLGLDGATFECLNPLIDQDIIPNIKEICSNWACGPLRTIFPPVTGPAWLSLATGLNPGKTGVFDYINRKSSKGLGMAPVSSAYYENRAIWDYLGKKGYKVGIYNYPTLSPPPGVNGFVVSGMGGYKKEHLCFPEELEQELNEVTNGYEVRLNLRSGRYRRNIDLFFEDLNRIITKQAKALRYLIEKKEWDFFFGVFSFTDWMQHLLWRHIDDTYPLYDDERSPNVKAKFLDTWRRIDQIIGDLFHSLADTHCMIVSDHGAGPIDSAFYPNTWLEKKGWLKKKRLGWRSVLAQKMTPLSADIDNKYFNKLIHVFKTKILKTNGTMNLIDLENSLAYSPEHAGMFGCINITQKGRELLGFKEQLVHELNHLAESLDGIYRVEIYLPELIYKGPYVDLAPDILFIINEYRTSVEIDLAREAFVHSPSLEMRTGGHRTEGVFIAKGDFFRNVQLQSISILDIAPTIMALYDMEIPSQMDGRVITECIRPELVSSVNIRKSDEVYEEKQVVKEEGDLEEMKKTLKSLGYI